MNLGISWQLNLPYATVVNTADLLSSSPVLQVSRVKGREVVETKQKISWPLQNFCELKRSVSSFQPDKDQTNSRNKKSLHLTAKTRKLLEAKNKKLGHFPIEE